MTAQKSNRSALQAGFFFLRPQHASGSFCTLHRSESTSLAKVSWSALLGKSSEEVHDHQQHQRSTNKNLVRPPTDGSLLPPPEQKLTTGKARLLQDWEHHTKACSARSRDVVQEHTSQLSPYERKQSGHQRSDPDQSERALRDDVTQSAISHNNIL